MVSWSSLASVFKLESFMRSFCSGVTRGVFRRWAIFSRSFCLKRAVLEGLVVVDIAMFVEMTFVVCLFVFSGLCAVGDRGFGGTEFFS